MKTYLAEFRLSNWWDSSDALYHINRWLLAHALEDLGMITELTGFYGVSAICTSEQLMTTFQWKEVTLEKVEERADTRLLGAVGAFQAASAKSIPTASTDANWNQKVEVHIPGAALSAYNRVMLCENACTDALQSALNAGWRIIAVCMQPDQRRPDYILGRYDAGYDSRAEQAERL